MPESLLFGPARTQAPRPYLFLPDGWDTNWRSAQAGGGTIGVNIYGDSIANGSVGGYVNGFGEQVFNLLRARLGRFADFYHAWNNTNDANIVGAPVFDNQTCTRDTFGPHWTGTAISAGLAASSVQTFTTPYACTQLDFIWASRTGDSATFKWQIDGGALTTVTNNGTNTINRITNSGLSNTTHTFAWGNQSASPACHAIGWVTYNPGQSAGVACGMLAASSTNCHDMNTGWIQNTQGVTGIPTGPQLALIELGINDNKNSDTAATYRDNLYALIRVLRYATPNISIVLLVNSYPNTTFDDCNPAGYSNPLVWPQFSTEIWNAARKLNCAVIDFHAKWGSRPFANGLLPNNDLHPTVAGQTDILNQLALIL